MDAASPPEPQEAIAGFRILTDHHPDPALLLEAGTGSIVEANPAAATFYDSSRETLRGQALPELVLDADALAPALQPDTPSPVEIRQRSADGPERRVEVRTGAVFTSRGPYLHATLREVTAERAQGEELQAYRELFEALPVGVFTNTAGHEGRFRAVNPALLRLVGADSRQQLMATPAVRLHQDPEERRRLSDQLLAREEVHDREVALRTLGGQSFRAACSARAWTAADGHTVFTGVLEDVTREKAAERALLHERQVASALRRTLGELLRGAARSEGLFEPVCRILVEEAGFRLARVGRLDAQGWLWPEAWAGEATDHLEGLVLGRDPSLPEGRGPGGQSLQTGEPRVIQDIAAEPSMQSWAERAASQGLHGEAALPFRQAGEVVGALLVYAPERDYFTDDIIGLLQQASHALGFALDQHQQEQERQRAERELHASEQRYRSIITAMAEGVALHGPDGAIIATNPAAEAVLGLSEGQIRGRDSMDPRWRTIREDGRPFSGEDHPAMVSLRTGRPVRDCIMGIEDPERGTRWIRINAEPLAGEDGPEGAVATFTDITEQRVMERDLAEREAHYRDLVENQPLFIGRFEPDTSITYANDTLARFLGTTPEALAGQRWIELLPTEEQAGARRHLASFTVERSVQTLENSLLREDGEPAWVQWTNRAFFDEAGRVTHFQSVGVDISERRAAERARDRLVRILECTPDFISISRPDGTVEYVNEGGRRLLGLPSTGELLDKVLPAADLDNHSAGEWAHPEWAARRIIEEGNPTAVAHGYWEGESALLDAEGCEVPVSQVILAHYEADGEVSRLSTIMRDIRPQKALQQALTERQHALQRLQDIVGDPVSELDDKVAALLRLGAEVFELPRGILSHIRGEDYHVRQAVSPDGSLAPGQHFDLGITYCVHTLAADGPVGFHHAGMSDICEHPCYRTQGMEACLGVPVRVGGEVYGTLNFSRPEVREPYSEFEWELIRLMGQWVSYELTREANHRALERLATHDALTGIANRGRLYELLEGAREEQVRYGTPFSVILFDIDHFKAVNDTHGHATGDAVLREVTRRVGTVLRETDDFGRWGGEEFLILTGHADRAGSEPLAERVRRAVSAAPFEGAGHITISLGVAAASPGEAVEALEERADRALYAAKAAGRDRVRSG